MQATSCIPDNVGTDEQVQGSVLATNCCSKARRHSAGVLRFMQATASALHDSGNTAALSAKRVLMPLFFGLLLD